jgi:phosphopantetheine adenylyltransferase
MHTNNEMLAPEILAHMTADRDLRVGDLAVFVDYKGREVGCSITRMWAAGEVSREAQIQIRVISPETMRGAVFTVDAQKVRRAI